MSTMNSKLTFKRGLELKNRIMMAPMTTKMSFYDGVVTVKAIDDFAAANGYINAISEMSPDGIIRRHHEIYLNDPRRVAPEKMKTVVRHPIRK